MVIVRRVIRKVVNLLLSRVIGTITHVATHHPVAALTFDDGPHPVFTPQLLGILENHKAKGTFFMLGEVASQHPDLVQDISRRGHAIGNHSWDHPSFPLISWQERRTQIRACEDVLSKFGCSHLFRPPYCHQNILSRLDALWLGYEVVTQNVTAQDWCDRSPHWMADHLIEHIIPGSIVGLHDAISRSVQEVPQYNRQPMLDAVNMMLDRLNGQIQFITVPELLRLGKPIRENWLMHASPEMMSRLQKHPSLGQS